MTDWHTEITEKDLPEHYQTMVGLIGIEATIKLAEFYNKQGFYFTGLDELVRRKKEDYIRKNFSGSNHKELARATGYSERWVYEIIERGRTEKKQMKMFEEE